MKDAALSLRARLPRKRGLYTERQKARFRANIADKHSLSLGGLKGRGNLMARRLLRFARNDIE